MAISLDGLRMHVIRTAESGVVNADTIFRFHQQANEVWADYAGGGIRRGSLIGTVDGSTLTFRYCQLQTNGTLDGGKSDCEVRTHEGRIQIVERFQWESRPGGGENVFQELGDRQA